MNRKEFHRRHFTLKLIFLALMWTGFLGSFLYVNGLTSYETLRIELICLFLGACGYVCLPYEDKTEKVPWIIEILAAIVFFCFLIPDFWVFHGGYNNNLALVAVNICLIIFTFPFLSKDDYKWNGYVRINWKHKHVTN